MNAKIILALCLVGLAFAAPLEGQTNDTFQTVTGFWGRAISFVDFLDIDGVKPNFTGSAVNTTFTNTGSCPSVSASVLIPAGSNNILNVTNFLFISDFGLKLPVGATPRFINITMTRSQTANQAIFTDDIRLFKNGIDSTTFFKLNVKDNLDISSWELTPTSKSYPRPDEDDFLWGGTWLSGDISNNQFGVRISVRALNTTTADSTLTISCVSASVTFNFDTAPVGAAVVPQNARDVGGVQVFKAGSTGSSIVPSLFLLVAVLVSRFF